jgi:MFS family permease
VSGDELEGRLTSYTGFISLFQNTGAFFGVYAFARITQIVGRKPTFAIMFVLAMLSTAFTFWFIGRLGGVGTAYAMVFVMGFCQIALFGGYAIYFPELFPTRLRATGTSFCYNVGRLVAAIGPFFLGYLTSVAFKWTERYGPDWPMRSACVTMCSIFLVGLVALAFAPETKDQPLPD